MATSVCKSLICLTHAADDDEGTSDQLSAPSPSPAPLCRCGHAVGARGATSERSPHRECSSSAPLSSAVSLANHVWHPMIYAATTAEAATTATTTTTVPLNWSPTQMECRQRVCFCTALQLADGSHTMADTFSVRLNGLISDLVAACSSASEQSPSGEHHCCLYPNLKCFSCCLPSKLHSSRGQPMATPKRSACRADQMRSLISQRPSEVEHWQGDYANRFGLASEERGAC